MNEIAVESKAMKAGWLIAIGVGALVFTRGKAIIKAFEASSMSVKGGRFVRLNSIEQSYIQIKLQISNPTQTSFSLGTFKGSLIYQGKPIAFLNYTAADVVKPGLNTILLPATLNNITTVDTVVNIIRSLFNGNFEQTVTLNGVFTKYSYRHPVNENFTLKDFL